MRAHSQVASVQKEGCRALRSLTKRIGPESATEARTVEAVLDAMRAHLHATQVLRHGSSALVVSTYCNDAAVERVAEAGGLQLVVAAMRAHPQVLEVQKPSVGLLYLCRGLLCRAPYGRLVSEAGGQAAVSAAMQSFPDDERNTHRGCALALRDCLRSPLSNERFAQSIVL